MVHDLHDQLGAKQAVDTVSLLIWKIELGRQHGLSGCLDLYVIVSRATRIKAGALADATLRNATSASNKLG